MGTKCIVELFQPGGGLADFFEKAARDLNMTLFFFTPADINALNYLITGVYYDRSRERWMKTNFPFPDILYLFGTPAGLRHSGPAQCLKIMSTRNVKVVNHLVEFNKWHLFRVLSANRELVPHLPETRLYRKEGKELKQMLRRYGGLYLKACRGSRGRQVMQVTGLPQGLFEYRYFVEKLQSGRVNMPELVGVIDHFFKRRKFIIQQPLDLLHFAGRKVDLRAELQRDGKGVLDVVAVPVRVARLNSPVTTHASSYRFDEFFAGMLGYSPAALSDLQGKLDALLFKVYRTVEQHYGPTGELGIDIGLDRSGKLWVIECNPLSARVSLMKAYDEKTVLRAFSNPLEYAIFTATRKG